MTYKYYAIIALLVIVSVAVPITAQEIILTWIGTDCATLSNTNTIKTCADLNYLNDRMTILESSVPFESFLTFTPDSAQGDDTITMSGMIEHNGYDDYSDEMYVISPNDIVYSFGSFVQVYENGTIYTPGINPSMEFSSAAGDGYYEVIVDYHGDEYVFGGFNYIRDP